MSGNKLDKISESTSKEVKEKAIQELDVLELRQKFEKESGFKKFKESNHYEYMDGDTYISELDYEKAWAWWLGAKNKELVEFIIFLDSWLNSDVSKDVKDKVLKKLAKKINHLKQ